MGHESQIELWSPNLTTFCFVGFGTDRLRREPAMKTADRENPIHGATWARNRAHGAAGQNRTRSIEWAEKQEKFRPKEMCFFLTSPFIELTRTYFHSHTLIPGGFSNWLFWDRPNSFVPQVQYFRFRSLRIGSGYFKKLIHSLERHRDWCDLCVY